MQSQNQMFDDFVKMLNGAAGTLAGMGREAQDSAKSRAKEWFGGLDFVGRDEFEAVKAMAAAARDEAAALRARLDVLERGNAPAATPAAGQPGGPASHHEEPAAAAPLFDQPPSMESDG